MTVFRYRRYEVVRIAQSRIEVGAGSALKDPPPIVSAQRNDVDFFSRSLTYVAGVELPGLPIE